MKRCPCPLVSFQATIRWIILGLLGIGVIFFILDLVLNNRLEGLTTVPLNPPTRNEKYDVYLATPMAGYDSEDKYHENRIEAMKIFNLLESEFKYKVYFAGRFIESAIQFDLSDAANIKNFEAMKASKFFILFYPESVKTSAFFEAGYALASNIPSIYIVKDLNDLPYLLKEVSNVSSCIKTYSYSNCTSIDEFLQKVKSSGKVAFEKFQSNVGEKSSSQNLQRGKNNVTG